MRILGLEIRRVSKAAPPALSAPARAWARVLESYPGAWQANVEVNRADVDRYGPVFACTSLIAADIGKLPVRTLRRVGAVWLPATDPVLSRLLRAPNHFSSTQQFLTDWTASLMRSGNSYALIDRDARGGAPVALTVLNPESVQPLITPRGDVYYRLRGDNLAGLTEPLLVPASEIIHHRINPLWHPLVGVSPLYAASLPAQTGTNIARHTTGFFANMARPGGILTAPGHISDSTAASLKAYWETEFAGDAAGKIAVVGDGLKFEQHYVTSVDAQTLDTLKLSAVQVAQAFRVPPFLIGAEPAPSVANAELLMQQYYRTCLQPIIEGIESALDAGLGLADDVAIELDAETGLLRLDTAARYASYESAMRAGWLAPNEIRAKEGLAPVEGGDSPMIQQQNFSLAALAKRDATGVLALAPPAAPTKAAHGERPRVRHRGEWDARRVYKQNDAVLRAGRLWRALRDDVLVYEPGDQRTGAAAECWEAVA